jgi:hypothetical protein
MFEIIYAIVILLLLIVVPIYSLQKEWEDYWKERDKKYLRNKWCKPL